MTRPVDLCLAEAALPSLERSVWVEVDIDKLTTNALTLCSKVHPAVLGVVVKADGYGHGLEMAARCAVAGGAEWLCVADSAEAIRLRDDGYRGRVLVLYPVPAAMVEVLARLGIDVTVGSSDDARHIADHLAPEGPHLAVHLEIDTGLTRGGVAPDMALATAMAIDADPSTNLTGVWTHFTAPEDSEITNEQLVRFRSVLTQLSEAGLDPDVIHSAASGGLLATDTREHGLVRPGLAYYGLHPGAGDALPHCIAPALSLRAHPVRLTQVPAGSAVGYAGTWVADRPSTIATLPVGYADGWSRSSSPGTAVLVAGRRAPVVGRVSSDSLTVDVTGIAGVEADSEFTLLGSDGADRITAEEIADVRGTISWEVLQQLGSRLTRVYVSNSSIVAIRPESTTRVIPADEAQLPAY